jgi:hypothetical protein
MFERDCIGFEVVTAESSGYEKFCLLGYNAK